jgi:hypothetical protein
VYGVPVRSIHTLLEKPSVTQDHKHKGHKYREAQSQVLTDLSDRSTWMMEFSCFGPASRSAFFLTVRAQVPEVFTS